MTTVTKKEIREIIDTLDITASEFARRTYVSRSYISHILAGRKKNPSRLWASMVAILCRKNRLGDIADMIEGRIG